MTQDIYEGALARCGDNPVLLAEIAGIVAQDGVAVKEQISQALERGELEAVREHAHALRGMLLTFEQGDASRGLDDVECFARECRLSEAIQRWDTCKADVTNLINVIESFGSRT